MIDLDKAILEHHSTRMFCPTIAHRARSEALRDFAEGVEAGA
jgi:hypothetical protein